MLKKKSSAPRRLLARLSAIDWLLIGYALLYLALFALRVLSTRDARVPDPFTVVQKPALISLFFDLALAKLICVAFRAAGVRLERRDVALWAGSLLVVGGYCVYNVLARDFIPYWDYACYYTLQLNYDRAFSIAGVLEGLRQLYSTFSYDYTMFITVFVQSLFAYTSRTFDAYSLCCIAIFLPPLLWMLLGLVKKAQRMVSPARPRAFVTLGYLSLASTPVLYTSFLRGQPDLMGLIFALMLILLTLDYRFERLEPARLIALLLAFLCLLVSRRWYAYTAVGYLACYGAWLLYDGARQKRLRAVLTRALPYAAACAAITCWLLRDMVAHILSYDYAVHYAFYYAGGFFTELASQLSTLGWGAAGLLLAGLAAGLCLPRTRRLAGMGAGGLLISVLLFTRIQQMGYHQLLLELPFQWLLLLSFWAVALGLPALWRRAVATLASALLAVNLVGSVLPSSAVRDCRAFAAAPNNILRTGDGDAVRAVDGWLLDALGDDGTAYIIPHNDFCIPDRFRYATLPDGTLAGRIAYGSAVPGTHTFPTDILTAPYVLTSEPFCNYGNAYKFNDVFLSLVERGVFELERTFDFGQGRAVLAYRRVQPVSADELAAYRAALSEESARFPEMYDGVIAEYEQSHGLARE